MKKIQNLPWTGMLIVIFVIGGAFTNISNSTFEYINKNIKVKKLSPNKIKIWINAFIPSDLNDCITPIPSGGHAGEYGISGPLPFSGYFVTDNRTYNTNPGASFRMQSLVEIDLSNSLLTASNGSCGKSIQLDGSDWHEICSNSVDASKVLVNHYTIGINPFGKNMINFTLDGNASDGCYPSVFTPSVRWKIPVTILNDTTTNKISIVLEGTTSAFPAFEMYTQIDDNYPVIIFQRYPSPGVGLIGLMVDNPIFIGKDLN